MYRGRLERDLRVWTEKGLIDGSTAGRLLVEYDQRESSFSLGRVLMVIAALLLSGAVLLLIAANWEAIPRVARLVGIVTLIWFAYVAAALLRNRGALRLSEAVLVAGILFFGGAIALVGQMYHLSGDATQASLVWFAGGAITAFLFRSATATAVCGVLAFVVAGTEWSDNFGINDRLLLWLLPVMAAVVIALVRFTDATRSRHLAYLLMVAWVLLLYGEYDTPATALAIAGVGGTCFLLATLQASPLRHLAANAGAAPAFYAFLLLLIGLLILHIETNGIGERLLLGSVTLVVAIGGIAISGRDNGAVRYLAYAAFAAESLYLASETLGSILGTSGFFLISGLVVGAIAWIVIRLERRFAVRNMEAGQ
ncbi:DUF2157 domain-containing protein [Rhizobium sp. ARZ01]|uniref:DUF2157 domain-containing protein n=1 Tax=Rhizobium sp. ARZ01 TaxID=2769313 RepID=UPI00177D00AE|nr:DUF2157 domain-containing protein [Rhizobium sp. ARZ01]MBD9372172.1 DUF2157 domain-containing protein [Rhizobium sp. ARZ01]